MLYKGQSRDTQCLCSVLLDQITGLIIDDVKYGALVRTSTTEIYCACHESVLHATRHLHSIELLVYDWTAITGDPLLEPASNDLNIRIERVFPDVFGGLVYSLVLNVPGIPCYEPYVVWVNHKIVRIIHNV
jgi:hypothetical protein